MFKSVTALLTLSLTAFNTCQAADETHAGRAVSLSGQASAATSGSAAHSIAASGQVTSAAVAVPLSASGAVMGSAGAASARAAHDSMKAATAPIGTPLPVTDEAITIMPPNEALKTKEEKKIDKAI